MIRTVLSVLFVAGLLVGCGESTPPAKPAPKPADKAPHDPMKDKAGAPK